MAYKEKYFIPFCNSENQSCRISVLEQDFTGETTELVGGSEPIIISYNNSEDFKFEPIIPSEAVIKLIFKDDTLSFQELWTSNERTFKVEYLIADSLEWTGFVIPSGFEYNLTGGRYEAELTASDGLSTLEGILFKTDNNELYGTQDLSYNNGFNFPFILVLTEILRKLDLGIDLWTLVDYYEQTMSELNSNTRESDPLAVSFVNVKTYINDTDRKDIPYFQDVNEAWDCMKIIENICHIWGSRIYQEKGVWRLKSIHADSAIAHEYTSESDSFVGENPEKEGNFWKYECYYSTNRDINFDITVNFYSLFETISLTDRVYSDGGVTPSVNGFYLVKGLDKLIQITNGQVINISFYEPVVTDYYWKKYNNTAGYLGRELAENTKTIPCLNKELFIKDNDAEVRMDEVYKQFRVNYEYTFIRDGDSPVNLIRNGGFSLPFEQYGGLEAPSSWDRWKLEGNVSWFPRGRVISLDSDELKETGGNTNALEMFIQYNDVDTPRTDPNPAVWGAFEQTQMWVDSKVDALYLKGWVKYRYKIAGEYYFPVFKFSAVPIENFSENRPDTYHLENIIDDEYDLGWVKLKYEDDWYDRSFFRTYPSMGDKFEESEQETFKWYNFNLKIQPLPVPANVTIRLHGLCTTQSHKNRRSNPPFGLKTNKGGEMVDEYIYSVHNMGNPVPRPQFTGLEFGYIPNPDEEVPKADYIYANGDVNYSFQEDPIEVYNGDGLSEEIISNITVSSNEGGINKWDTFNNAFGTSDIGMILCKSIMQQYYKPKRLFDCDFKDNNFRYGNIIQFEHIPYIKFIMLRGSFNAKRGYWEDCTLAEISNDNIAPGGIINGNSLSPNWQITGRVRCVKDDNGLNTGIQEYETLDINSNSDSFGNYRWQSSGENLTSCPIGETSKYYWGTDADDYEIDNLTDFTVKFEDETIGEVQVSYDNTGGKYIYFLHLASLGSVVQVSNQYQGQIISSFTYLADTTINGYLYRVLRQNFVTSEMQDFPLTYYIQ